MENSFHERAETFGPYLEKHFRKCALGNQIQPHRAFRPDPALSGASPRVGSEVAVGEGDCPVLIGRMVGGALRDAWAAGGAY